MQVIRSVWLCSARDRCCIPYAGNLRCFHHCAPVRIFSVLLPIISEFVSPQRAPALREEFPLLSQHSSTSSQQPDGSPDIYTIVLAWSRNSPRRTCPLRALPLASIQGAPCPHTVGTGTCFPSAWMRQSSTASLRGIPRIGGPVLR